MSTTPSGSDRRAVRPASTAPVPQTGSNRPPRAPTTSSFLPVHDPGLRARIEDFLFYEASILDEWQLDKWLELLTDDATYCVPSTDLPDGDPRETLPIVNDKIERIQARVVRLESRMAHAEFPMSRTRRLISNVRVLDVRDGEIDVTANFIVYRIRHSPSPYVGRYVMTLVPHGESFRIRRRRAELDSKTLAPEGVLSFIL